MNSSSTTGEALLVLDPYLTVRAANKAFYAMFRLAPGECVGHKVYELGGRAWNEKLRSMLEAVLNGEPQSDHFELIHDDKEGGKGVLWLSARLVPSADPLEATILLAIEDLTAGRPVEETLATKIQELHTFADMAGRGAHELNNLLTVIRMNADILESLLSPANLSTQEAADIRLAAERAEAITKKLLLTSRRVLPQPTGLDRGASSLPLPGSPLKESDEERAARESAEAKSGKIRRLKHGKPTGRETILLVDDEKALRKLGKRVLTDSPSRDSNVRDRLSPEAVHRRLTAGRRSRCPEQAFDRFRVNAPDQGPAARQTGANSRHRRSGAEYSFGDSNPPEGRIRARGIDHQLR